MTVVASVYTNPENAIRNYALNHLIQNLQPELNNAGFEGAGDNTAAGRGCAESASKATRRKVEVSVIEAVI